jgi:YD repeat-containing protein
LRQRFISVVILSLLISFSLSGLANAQGNYRYEYDENNKLIKIFKDEITYMTFDYDKNGNLIKKEAWLKPPQNIQAEIIGNNSIKLNWEAVPGATSYQIYLKTEAEPKALEVASTNNTFIEFKKLNINTNYTFVLKSKDENGMGSKESNVVSITLDLGDVLLSPVYGTLLKGTIPMPGIMFSIHSLDGTKWYDSTSNQAGEFVLLLPDGQYQLDGIWIAAEGLWYEKYQQFTVFNGKLVAKENLSVTLNESKLTGTLKKGTEILANVSFSIQSQTGEKRWYQVESDQSGNFSLIIPGGIYKLHGVWLSSENKWYELQKEFDAQGEIQLDINILEPNGPFLKGTLKKGDLPITNVSFSIRATFGNRDWYDIQTDENGNFSKLIPNGTYILEGVWLESESFWYEMQIEFTINGELQLPINLLDRIKGNVTGVLKKDAQPLGNNSFSIYSHQDDIWYLTKTDESGEFDIKLANGNYTISGIWVEAESKWYELNKSFTVDQSLQIDIEI